MKLYISKHYVLTSHEGAYFDEYIEHLLSPKSHGTNVYLSFLKFWTNQTFLDMPMIDDF